MLNVERSRRCSKTYLDRSHCRSVKGVDRRWGIPGDDHGHAAADQFGRQPAPAGGLSAARGRHGSMKPPRRRVGARNNMAPE